MIRAELKCTCIKYCKVRCAECPGCVEFFAIIERVLAADGSAVDIARETGLALSNAKHRQTKWLRDRGRSPRIGRPLKVKAYPDHEPDGPRPRCHCGLSIDKDHQPATCDFGLTTTGLGSWEGVTW